MECLVLAIIVTIIVVAISTGFSGSGRSVDRVYRQLTERVGGTRQWGLRRGSPSVRFVHRGATAVLDTTDGRVGGPPRSTRLRIPWPDERLQCEITCHHDSRRVIQFPQLPVVTSGSSDFDDDYAISGNDPRATHSFLSEGVQSAIQRLRYSVHGPDIYVAISQGTLVVKKKAIVRDVAQLERFFQLSVELYDQALLTRTDGIRFVDSDDIAQPIDQAICQVCGEDIASDMVFCRRCKTPHHRDCWHYNGWCSTYGCREHEYVVPDGARRVDER